MNALRTLRRHLSRWAVLTLAALLLAGGCASKAPPKAPQVDEAALKRDAEAKARQAEEQRRLAEERRKAEEKRQQEEVLHAFGPVGQPPALPGAGPVAAVAAPQGAPATGTAAPQGATGAAAGTAAPQGTTAAGPAAALVAPAEIPFDDAVPALPPDPTVRVAVLSHDAPPSVSREVAALIGTWERDRIEEHLGMAVKILYVAESSQPLPRGSEIHYRKDYLRAAQSVASVMFAAQWIGPMTAEEQRQEDVDLVIHIGKTYP